MEIAAAQNDADLDAIEYLEDQVFRKEMRVRLPQFQPNGSPMLRLLARLKPNDDVAGTLTIVETTDNHYLHQRCHLPALPGQRIARYTRLAVLPHHRGRGLAIRLMLEAHKHWVVPNGIDETWLLLDNRRAPHSLIGSVLGFSCGDAPIRSEYGMCRLMSRNERSQDAIAATHRGWAFIGRYEQEPAISRGCLVPAAASTSNFGSPACPDRTGECNSCDR